jgi:serine protease
MRHISALFVTVWASFLCLTAGPAWAGSPEWNPIPPHPVEIGPQANRLVVGFRVTPGNSVIKEIKSRRTQAIRFAEAQTSRADVAALTQRLGLVTKASRQFAPSMHVVLLEKTLYGADVAELLDKLRADPAVAFADVDERRYPQALPNDPLFLPTATASGQWYMQTPPATATPTGDAAATDAVSAWGITQGSSGTVIADIDNGIRFDHPDLLRAGFGGRLLPGYDFVSPDLDAANSAQLGTFLVANDGDGWDPDPSDPGDWIDTTDLKNTQVFPSKNCSVENSSWHGTRVMGVLGALTNNDVGIAGMTWNPYLLPVRALGKCGGLDSDIMVAMRWSVGLTVFDDSGSPVPENPYPADIINLSLGGTGGSCPASYQTLVTQLAGMGVLVVASAGNESGPVDIPASCPGVLAVAGLRNVGTKVGYSSLGPEVGVGAPAGNCVNTTAGLPCLRSIDTTINEGLTTPAANGYTDQTNSNLGTSFSAPIVSGIAALMRSANANLTPPQLIARIKASATPFPQPAGVAQCVNGSTSMLECACTTGTCGAGMVNAFSAVKAALNPIAAVKIPAGFNGGSATFDAGGSAAACGATIATYAWSKTGAVTINSVPTSPQAIVTVTGAGTLKLIVTDSAGNTDMAIVTFTASTSITAATTAPSVAGTAASACAADMTVAPAPPTVGAAFSPASVAANTTATLVVTFGNSNGFALTQSGITVSLPANLTVGSQTPVSSCGGAALSLTTTSSSVTLAGANIPADGSCDISVSVQSASPSLYTASIPSNALVTGPAGSNTAAASATLTVTAASSGLTGAAPAPSGGGGGGALDWTDILLIAGVLLVARGHAAKRMPRAGAAPARTRRRR